MTSGTNYENMEVWIEIFLLNICKFFLLFENINLICILKFKQKVIAVSSGTKCVSGERLSTCGLAVNDCHAEVVSRRCFQEYLYDCLKDIADSSGKHICL